MIVWHTDTDNFVVGQWVKGMVHQISLCSDGSHAAVGIRSRRPVREVRGRVSANDDREYYVICRPPYFTALEIWVGSWNWTFAHFYRDQIYHNADPGWHELRARDTRGGRPFLDGGEPWPSWEDLLGGNKLNSRTGPAEGKDQSGRAVRLADGCIYAEVKGKWKLLLDTCSHRFEEVETPGWARSWGRVPRSRR